MQQIHVFLRNKTIPLVFRKLIKYVKNCFVYILCSEPAENTKIWENSLVVCIVMAWTYKNAISKRFLKRTLFTTFKACHSPIKKPISMVDMKWHNWICISILNGKKFPMALVLFKVPKNTVHKIFHSYCMCVFIGLAFPIHESRVFFYLIIIFHL